MRMGNQQSYVFEDTKVQKKKKLTLEKTETIQGSEERFFFKVLLISFKRFGKTLIHKTKTGCHEREVKRNNF